MRPAPREALIAISVRRGGGPGHQEAGHIQADNQENDGGCSLDYHDVPRNASNQILLHRKDIHPFFSPGIRELFLEFSGDREHFLLRCFNRDPVLYPSHYQKALRKAVSPGEIRPG